MSDGNISIYFAGVCGFISVMAPTMSSTIMRLTLGVVIGFYSFQAWPLVKIILRDFG